MSSSVSMVAPAESFKTVLYFWSSMPNNPLGVLPLELRVMSPLAPLESASALSAVV